MTNLPFSCQFPRRYSKRDKVTEDEKKQQKRTETTHPPTTKAWIPAPFGRT